MNYPNNGIALLFLNIFTQNCFICSKYKICENILLFSPCFFTIIQNVVPNQIVVQILGRNTVELSHELFQI